MTKLFGALSIIIFHFIAIIKINATLYDRTVIFTVFNNQTGESFVSTFDEPMDCDRNGLFAFVIHGWEESIKTEWVVDIIRNLMYFRGGCVIVMDYSRFSKQPYVSLAVNFGPLARTLVKKIQQTTSNYENLFLFGFSFGSRLAFEAGVRIGHQKIDRIDACDPAGPGFDEILSTTDPKLAAKSVNCINTSANAGTRIYNCHMNFRMGICGSRQIGAKRKPMTSHGLCPHFYNSAFTNDFMENNYHNCSTRRPATEIPNDFKMGYMEKRRASNFFGDIFIATTRYAPWNVVRGESIIL